MTQYSFIVWQLFNLYNSGHVGWLTWSSDITVKADPLKKIQANVGSNWLSCFRGEEIFIKVNDFHVTILLSNFLYLAMFDSGWVDHD